MIENNTIAAISTAQGTGGIAIIRISGDNSIKICDTIFKSVSGKKICEISGYTALFGAVYNQNEKLDEVVVTLFRNPHSYTGEDVVEISCHGGIFITNQILRTVLNNGAVPARAGEFTMRAFLNGKLDLTEAEAVMDIIAAKSKTAVRAALTVKDGALRKKIDKVKNDLITQAAHLSAWADYPEEDIAEVSQEELFSCFNTAKHSLNELLNSYDAGQAIKEGIDTVIAGRPNAGKSTLMNLLSGTQKSIVTDIPGTTRDIIEETVVLDDVILRLSDTAGLRDTENSIEKIGVELAKKRLETCGLVLAVFDNNQKLNEEDINLIDILNNVPSVAIINKIDLESKIDLEYIKSHVKNIVFISAKNDEGISKLKELIAQIAGTDNFDPSQAVLANERQRTAVVNAVENIDDALTALNLGMTFDAVTVSLDDAISALLELTGERASEVVVDHVFHNFCVGK